MLLSLKHLGYYTIEAEDGNVGQVYSFLFDDQQWIVRYLVVDTGKLLPGRKVLVIPSALAEPDNRMRVFPVKLTREQVKQSPDIDADKPISMQQELELHKYYKWSSYWEGYGPILTPYAPVVPGLSRRVREKPLSPPGAAAEEKSDNHLRSTKEVIGYKTHADDGEIGHIDDLVVNTSEWVIRYIVVDTRNWLPGRKVIIPPDWINSISWAEAAVNVGVSRKDVKSSPEFDSEAPVNREYENELYDYYGRPKYWLTGDEDEA